jgi:predicted metalloprotease with PDZ domain
MRSCGWIVAAFTACAAAAAPTTEVAKYEVKLLGASPLRFSIRADLPIHGAGLDMFSSYPAELPEMAANGWPALVFNFKAADRSGKPIALESAGAKGWKLAQAYDGRIVLSYDVDFSIFAAKSWPSPLESAYEDATHIVVSARALFVTTGQIGSVEVDLDIPGSWRPVMPWARRASSGTRYIVRTAEDLTDNMLVFSTVAPDVVKAAGFTMQITAMGHWEPLRPTVRDVLGTVIEREVKLMHYREPETYSVVLLPIDDEGGEAYRQSFVYCFANPSAGNRATWGNTLAHEIFHYWNYARLRGEDYASTQWFQEGFTEYVANVTLVSGKITDPDTFMAKLGKHVQNYRKLTTTLEAIGTKKGPPLYSAGALVAFSWDVMIRKASGGRRNIGNFFRNLWKQTGGGAREYAWPDIRAALEATASADWEAFYQAHIKGHDALPLDDVMATAGLKLGKDAAGLDVVELDPAASVSERTLWLALVGGT